MPQIPTTEKKTWIPRIPPERITELAKQIRPIVDFNGIGKCYIQPVDLFSIAYTWAAKPAEKAINLKHLCDITTYHSYGAPVYFKPSIAEVLAQIPTEHLDKVIAFEIVGHPLTCDDLNNNLEALKAGYHVATTRLYVQQ